MCLGKQNCLVFRLSILSWSSGSSGSSTSHVWYWLLSVPRILYCSLYVDLHDEEQSFGHPVQSEVNTGVQEDELELLEELLVEAREGSSPLQS